MNEFRPFVEHKGGTVVEIGSRDGHDADKMTKIFRASRTIVVEANPECYDDIIRSYPKYESYNVAISDSCGEMDFWKVDGRYGETLLGQSSLLYKDSYRDIATKIRVPALTMDDFVGIHDIDAIEAMKIDVEGATIKVLNGFSNIRITRLIHVESEHKPFWDGQSLYEDTASFLTAAGYEQVYFMPVWTDQSDSIWRRID